MSEDLELLAEYSKAIEAGDEQAARVSPEAVGTDIQGEELRWWTDG